MDNKKLTRVDRIDLMIEDFYKKSSMHLSKEGYYLDRLGSSTRCWLLVLSRKNFKRFSI